MKIRKGFVSHSSSTSVIVSKRVLSEEQIVAIRDHIKYSSKNFPQIGWADADQYWNIDETDEQMRLYTCMDNFDMHEFLLALGIKDDNLNQEDY
jgi:hypothetical protein